MSGFSIAFGNTNDSSTYTIPAATYGGGYDQLQNRVSRLEQLAFNNGALGTQWNNDRFNSNYRNTNYQNGWNNNHCHCHDGNRMQQWAPPQNNWQYASAAGYQPNNYYDNNQRFTWPPMGGYSYSDANTAYETNRRGFSISLTI